MFHCLADSNPTITIPITSPIFWLGTLALGVPAFIATLNGLLSIIARFKKLPPDHERYAAKTELHEVEERITGELTAVEQRFIVRVSAVERSHADLLTQLHQDNQNAERIRAANNAELKTIHQQMGTLIGQMDVLLKGRKG